MSLDLKSLTSGLGLPAGVDVSSLTKGLDIGGLDLGALTGGLLGGNKAPASKCVKNTPNYA